MPSLAPRPETSSRLSVVRYAAVLTVGAVIFIASVWYVGRTFQWNNIAQILKNVNLWCLGFGGGSSIVLYWMLRTLRWHMLLRKTDSAAPLLDAYMSTAVSLSFALFTPLQSGEVLKIELLKRHGLLDRSPGYGTLLLERALDLATVLTMACVSLLTTLNLLPSRTLAYGIMAALAIVSVMGLLVLYKLRPKGRARRLLEHMRRCVGDLRTLIAVIAITCVSWASVAFSWQIFLYSAGLYVSFVKAMALMSVVALIGIASLVPGGLGVTEAGASQLLMRFGFSAAASQAGSLVLRSYSIVAIAMGAAHWGLWRLIRFDRIRQLAHR